MQFLRTINGCTLREVIRSEDIYQEIEMTNILDITDWYHRNWMEHLNRKDDGQLPKLTVREKNKVQVVPGGDGVINCELP